MWACCSVLTSLSHKARYSTAMTSIVPYGCLDCLVSQVQLQLEVQVGCADLCLGCLGLCVCAQVLTCVHMGCIMYSSHTGMLMLRLYASDWAPLMATLGLPRYVQADNLARPGCYGSSKLRKTQRCMSCVLTPQMSEGV